MDKQSNDERYGCATVQPISMREKPKVVVTFDFDSGLITWTQAHHIAAPIPNARGLRTDDREGMRNLFNALKSESAGLVEYLQQEEAKA